MSDNANQADAPAFAIAVQYLKALSFDNAGAPKSFRTETRDNAAESKSDIKIDVQVVPVETDEEHFEVQTLIEIISKTAEDKTRFILRASYGAIALARNLSEENQKMLLNVETPRLTFPFLRAIISHAAHEAGYPALNLAPIDFLAVYNQKQKQSEESEDDTKA